MNKKKKKSYTIYLYNIHITHNIHVCMCMYMKKKAMKVNIIFLLTNKNSLYIFCITFKTIDFSTKYTNPDFIFIVL